MHSLGMKNHFFLMQKCLLFTKKIISEKKLRKPNQKRKKLVSIF
jgi:hypothetical protein